MLLGFAGADWFWGTYRENEDRQEFTRQLQELEVEQRQPARTVRTVAKPPMSGLGVLKIERIGLEVLIREGAGHAVLAQGAGWIPGTALPGHRGNVGVAAHRDTFFRELRNVRVGDEVTLMTPLGVRQFRVDRTQIVEPTEVDVLKHTRRDSVTLVTCFPFDYIGAAPQRFIVHASLASQAAVRPRLSQQ
jgi:sortase A